MDQIWLLIMGILTTTVFIANDLMLVQGASKSRQKRLIWVTNDGRLALPPGTLLTITPTISMPFVRYPPEGFLSNMTISLPFTINFDMLGLTDNQNPYGVLPPLLARNLGRSAGAIVADYLSTLVHKRRKARSVNQDQSLGLLHGGERALLYVVIEDFLSNWGLDGKACLLRAICEVQSHSMERFGLFGEMMKLFFAASKSPYSDILQEYVNAEKRGIETGECYPYFKKCPKSLFLKREQDKYTSDSVHHSHDELDEDENTISNLNVTLPDLTSNDLEM